MGIPQYGWCILENNGKSYCNINDLGFPPIHRTPTRKMEQVQTMDLMIQMGYTHQFLVVSTGISSVSNDGHVHRSSGSIKLKKPTELLAFDISTSASKAAPPFLNQFWEQPNDQQVG